MGVPKKGPWQEQEIEQFLTSGRTPLRLACVGKDGFPRVVSLWYQFSNGHFYCVTHQDSELVGLLRENDRAGFEVSPNLPPYCGVRGQALVELSPLEDAQVLESLLCQYLGDTNSELANWLLSRADQEILLRIKPTRFYSWDYRKRMHDIAVTP